MLTQTWRLAYGNGFVTKRCFVQQSNVSYVCVGSKIRTFFLDVTFFLTKCEEASRIIVRRPYTKKHTIYYC